jgi:hypothetical protein
MSHHKINWRPFEQARKFAHSLGFKKREEWEIYCKSEEKPQDTPSRPDFVYKKEWVNWGDWLGTGTLATKNKKYRSFHEARKFAHSLGFKKREEWVNYLKLRKKPVDIPAYPDEVYEEEWVNWGDWLGTGFIAYKQRQFLPFAKAREIVHKLRLENVREWQEYSKSEKRPANIPTEPAGYYKKEWVNWGDWLGTGTPATKNRIYRPFDEAREFVRSLGLKGDSEWRKYRKSGKKPDDIPANPWDVYKDQGWTTIGDWLGTGYIAHKKRKYKQFKEAREFVHKLGFKGQQEWYDYCESGKKPADIPANPRGHYKKEWTDFPDWLGYEEKHWTINKVKVLLKAIIDGNLFDTFTQDFIHS